MARKKRIQDVKKLVIKGSFEDVIKASVKKPVKKKPKK
jgi:hypothetical protein